jgi:hypothetical protein
MPLNFSLAGLGRKVFHSKNLIEIVLEYLEEVRGKKRGLLVCK